MLGRPGCDLPWDILVSRPSRLGIFARNAPDIDDAASHFTQGAGARRCWAGQILSDKNSSTPLDLAALRDLVAWRNSIAPRLDMSYALAAAKVWKPAVSSTGASTGCAAEAPLAGANCCRTLGTSGGFSSNAFNAQVEPGGEQQHVWQTRRAARRGEDLGSMSAWFLYLAHRSRQRRRCSGCASHPLLLRVSGLAGRTPRITDVARRSARSAPVRSRSLRQRQFQRRRSHRTRG